MAEVYAKIQGATPHSRMVATCIALGGAFQKHRSGDRMSMNRWLRFRVIAQGFTVAVAVIAGWEMAQQRKAERRVDTAGNEEIKAAQAAAERKRFEARMKEAEEAHRIETGGAS